MRKSTQEIIDTGKNILLGLHHRNTVNFQDDTDYIPTLKIVIRGAVFTTPDSMAKEQVQQELLSYARNLYLQFWLENESDASAVTSDQ